MKNNTIIFENNNASYLAFFVPCKKSDVYRYDTIEVAFYLRSKKYIVYTNDYIVEALVTLNNLLKRAIADKLQLHESINKDIGFLWNEVLQDKGEMFPAYQLGGIEHWVGEKYLLWSVPGKYSTWLYQRGSEIFLEITPVYPWHFSEPKPTDQYYSYEEFIKNYKPLAVVEISKETAQRWLQQIEALLKIIEQNDAKALKH